MTPLIKLDGVGKKYKTKGGEVAALDSVSLEIGQGEFVAVTGPSGSGKSTLLNVLGLLDTPDAGRYDCAGHPASGLSAAELAALRGRLIGFVFQNFYALPELTALENAGLPLEYGAREASLAPQECLELVELGDRLGHRPAELSGGQQQRLAIARAIVNSPRLVLADEPTGNLDPQLRDEILAVFEKLHKSGVTVVIVTHDPAVAARASRVIKMENGRVKSGSGARAPAHAAPARPARLPRPAAPSALSLVAMRAAAAAGCVLRNKTRSFIIFACFAAGIASVAAALGLTGAFRERVLKRVGSLDPLVINVYPDRKPAALAFSDAAAAAGLPHAASVAVSAASEARVSAGGRAAVTAVYEIAPSRLRSKITGELAGRLLDDGPADAGAALLLGRTARELFAGGNPVGRTIELDGEKFSVAGVIEGFDEQETEGADASSGVIIRPRAAAAFKGRVAKLIEVRADAEENVAALAARLSERFNGPAVPGAAPKKRFAVRQNRLFIEAMRQRGGFINYFLAALAAIPLLLAGLAVASTMLLSVGERRAEIGLRMAVGARKRDILLQFLCESFLLYAAGAVAGGAVAAAALYKLSALTNLQMHLSARLLLAGAGLTGASGLLFSLWPALRAAAVDPIRALRGG